MTRLAQTALLAALALAAPAAFAQSSSGMGYPDKLAAILQDAGYRASLGAQDDGTPMISSATAGVNFDILFYECDATGACLDLQFSAGFDLAKGIEVEAINEWNRTRFIGKAWTDGNRDPIVEYGILGIDGMSRASFERALARWEVVLDDFTETIGW